MIPSGSDATKTVQLLAALAAVAVVVAGLIGSVAAALAALLVALVTWRVGVKTAAVAAAIAVVLLGAEFFQAGASEWPRLAAAVLLMAASVGVTKSIQQLSQTMGVGLSVSVASDSSQATASPRSSGAVAAVSRSTPRAAPAMSRTPHHVTHNTPRPHPRVDARRPEKDGRTELDVVHRYLRDARDMLGADDMMFWRYNARDGELHPHSWATDPDVKPKFLENASTGGLVRRAIDQRAVVWNADDERSVFVVGPVGKTDAPHGVLAIHAADKHTFNRDIARRWFSRYSSHLGLLLELLEEGRTLRRYRARAQRFDQAVDRIQRNLDSPGLFQAICENAVDITAGTRAALLLWESEADAGSIRATSPAHPILENFRVSGASLLATAVRSGQRFNVRDARLSIGRAIYGMGEPQRQIGSLGITPLKRGDRVLGAIIVEGDAPSQITPVEVELLWQLSTIIVGVLEATHQLERLEESALTDALTGLPNRRSFDRRLVQHLAESDRYGHATSLVLLDIDHFKKVNDTHGHQGGDAVLRQVAKVVNSGVRLPIDMCARFGGEELAILLPQTGLAGAVEMAERLRLAVESTHTIVGGRRVSVTASFGVASYPESTRTSEQLFSAADRALYEAKAAGRNCVKSFNVKV
ncbi:MAG TPA: sensor domain-containing diguanylate cyclase [Gemmatimonadaceae bacterium]|nr:sensor domain-containing diguanylate cyclase [Gemmatimonadaceae bacterium]